MKKFNECTIVSLDILTSNDGNMSLCCGGVKICLLLLLILCNWNSIIMGYLNLFDPFTSARHREPMTMCYRIQQNIRFTAYKINLFSNGPVMRKDCFTATMQRSKTVFYKFSSVGVRPMINS